MKFDKTLIGGSTALLVLSLLSDGDKYGYEMVLELARRSDNAFELKEGTLYPLLHALENAGDVRAYPRTSPSGRERRYYSLTEKGRRRLMEKTEEWRIFSESVNAVLRASALPDA
jgi:PadR family transcriptional regulator PadR